MDAERAQVQSELYFYFETLAVNERSLVQNFQINTRVPHEGFLAKYRCAWPGNFHQSVIVERSGDLVGYTKIHLSGYRNTAVTGLVWIPLGFWTGIRYLVSLIVCWISYSVTSFPNAVLCLVVANARHFCNEKEISCEQRIVKRWLRSTSPVSLLFLVVRVISSFMPNLLETMIHAIHRRTNLSFHCCQARFYGADTR